MQNREKKLDVNDYSVATLPCKMQKS